MKHKYIEVKDGFGIVTVYDLTTESEFMPIEFVEAVVQEFDAHAVVEEYLRCSE